MKQRFSSLDVKVIAYELSIALCSLRLANVYDLSSKIFLLKFAKPDHRQQIVIDSGFRCHLTSFTRVTASSPSPFVARLRKFLRTRRVTSVSQVGTDRIIEIQFSDGQYRLFLEFYAGGNIVLTDRDLSILSLLRIVAQGSEQEELRVGLQYSLKNRQNYDGVPELTKERILKGLQRSVDKANNESTVTIKKSKKSGHALRKALSTSLNEFPPMLVEHAMRMTGFDPDTPVDAVIDDDLLLEKLILVLSEAQKVISDITSSDSSRGFIISKSTKSEPLVASALESINIGPDVVRAQRLIYEDFHPFRPAQFEGNPDTQILVFGPAEFGFNKTVDEFFSSIEGQKLESRLAEREENAKRKLTSARQDHEKRISGLQQVQELNIRKAQAIEANLQQSQEAIAALNGLVAQGMDWVEIARLIEMEQARQNVVAEIIKLPLKLYENTATLLLPEPYFNGEEDYEGDQTDSDVSDSEDEKEHDLLPSGTVTAAAKRLTVDVDLALSAWSNSRQYYNQKKTAAVKEQKTLQSSSKALKNTEKKISADLKKGLKQEKQVLRPVRQQHWFEKFIYFISSEGYLVLAGKDTQQDEILYRRYLKKGDVYVHADLQGAASIFIQNKPGMSKDPIPPSTLSQAGTLTVASSVAWESKAVMPAWWVNSEQVSKTATNGEYLSNSGFNIRGQKNFLPPAQLIMGFGVMFQISDDSKARHIKHRFQHKQAKQCGKTSQEDIADQAEKGKESAADNEIDEIERQSSPRGKELGNLASETDSDDPKDQNEELHDSDVEGDNPLLLKSVRAIVTAAQATGDDSLTEDASAINLDPQGVTEGSDDEEPSMGQVVGNRDDSTDLLPSTSNRPRYDVRHVPSRERRLLRSGPAIPSIAASQHSQQTPESDSENNFSMPPTSAPSFRSSEGPAAAPPNARVRGKHAKRHKLRTKYADQDETDRALALRLLGSAAGQKVTDDVALKAAKEQEVAAQRERRRQQHATAAQKGKEAEEMRRAEFEEGTEILEEEEATDLEAFVGTPLPGDEILDILVVCGPWDAVGTRCRWRAKLQPGTMKKGKAIREILGKWLGVVADREKRTGPVDTEEGELTQERETMRREGELLKNIRQQEVVGIVSIGKCRVFIGGEGADSKGKGGGGNGTGKRGGKGSKKPR